MGLSESNESVSVRIDGQRVPACLSFRQGKRSDSQQLLVCEQKPFDRRGWIGSHPPARPLHLTDFYNAVNGIWFPPLLGLVELGHLFVLKER